MTTNPNTSDFRAALLQVAANPATAPVAAHLEELRAELGRVNHDRARLRAAEWYKSLTREEREAANYYADLEGQMVENGALREANARAAERIREEQQRTERMVAILQKWNRLCEMGLMDVTKEWVRPAIMELWEQTDEAIPTEPDQVPTEHTEHTEEITTKDTKNTKEEEKP